MKSKGLNVDDTTLQYCTSKITELWPNTFSPVSTVRIFRPWAPEWNRPRRVKAMQELVQYAKANGVKVLLTSSMGCNTLADEENWRWTKDLLARLTPRYVMGLAIGDEVDRYYRLVRKGCAQRVWDKGRFWREFVRRVKEFDEMGFGHLPITSALSSRSVYSGFPFMNIPGRALVNDFLKNVTAKYPSRYVFTFNVDPYLDRTLRLDPGSNDTCTGALEKALCWKPGCSAWETMMRIRRRMKALTGSSDHRLWIGKVGWPSRGSKTIRTPMNDCPDFYSNETLETFYRGFLQWDGKLGEEAPPEHVFYHSLRNAPVFGTLEHFGLVTTCEAPTCKLFAANVTETTVYFGADLYWLPLAFAGILLVICLMTVSTVIYVAIARCMGIIKLEPDVNSDSDSSSSYEE